MLSIKNQEKIIAVLEHKNYKSFKENFIAYPTDTKTVSSLVKLANKFNFNITTVGSGSTFNNSEIFDNILYLSTAKLNKILEVDIQNLFINVGSGMVWSKLFNDLNEKSMFFPLIHEKDCGRTIGGIFSTLKPFYSAATYFKGIEFVSPTGEIISYGCKTLKNVAGYDLSQFMLGSFGKFGVITSILLKLFPNEKTLFTYDTILESCSNDYNNDEFSLLTRIKKEIDPNDILV
ncbi:MAG: FAD-binding oxidoreductase [Candidatus Delongbacteria bacterium]|jgi:glycolate oxidase|nr:FAD-binding oxidoreductase [Candidatus Delongbacteria bacterium]